MSRFPSDPTVAVRSELPPGPALPGWEVARQWIERPVEFWEECGGRFGDTFTIELGSIGTSVLFSHPEAVREIFDLSPETYEVRPYNGYSGTVMGDRAIFRTDGAEHRRKRRLIIPQLTRRSVDSHRDAARRLVRELIDSWETGQIVSPRPALHLLTLKFILEIGLGTLQSELAREVVRIFSQDVYPHLGSWSSWSRFIHLQPRLRELITQEVILRRSGADREISSVLDAMVRARDESGAPVDHEEIQDHLFTLLIVGADPAAIVLSWLLYWIHADPEVLHRLRRELFELGPPADAKSVAELPYLTAVVQESLRMYPVPATPSGRKLLVPVAIQGRIYEPGITLLPCTYLVHRRQEIYPDPSRFDPDRFLGRRFAPHEFFPFGGGNRACVGAGLAPLEIKLIMAEILACCEFEPAHEGPVRPVRHGTLIAPSDALRFVVAKPSGAILCAGLRSDN